MKVLVTGGAGFVGRHMVKRLADRGDEVFVVDSMVSESAQHHVNYMDHLKPIGGNVCWDYRDCREFFRDCDEVFDMVIHLAAVVGGRLTIENQPLSVAEDLAIDAMMFNWAVRTQQKKVVFLSSSAAYPIEFQRRDYNMTLREDLIDLNGFGIGMPDMSYGWAKLTGEYLAKLAHEKNGLKSVCFRPFSGYGEDQHLSYPFPSLVKRVVDSGGKAPVDVWGSGEQVRDLIYIDDCIDAILHIAPKIDDGRAVNLGTGNPTSFNKLIMMTWAMLYDGMPQINRLLDKPEGVFWRVSNPVLMESYGFIPKKSLIQGLMITLDKQFGIRL